MHDIFYFTDIHGMYDLYKAIINYCNEQEKAIQERNKN